MSQKQFSAADQPESEQPPNSQMNMAAGRRKTSESGQRSEETTFSSTKSGSLNGDAKRNGKSRRRRRRCKERSSNSENGTEKVNNQTKADEKPEENGCRPSSTAPGLSGLQSERANVWFEHSPYEQAESLYQSQLVSSSNVTTQSNCSPPGMVQESQSFSAVTSSSSHLVCHNGDQVACHHIVQQVSVYKTSFDQAESCYVEEYMQTSILNSLDLSSTFNLNCVAPRIPDEGYPSLTATPATPVTQCVAVTPTNQQLINGLPHIPVELPKDVWLENPMYDHAEAAFYENLYNNTSRSNDHPQSLVEVEEDTEADEQEVAAVEEMSQKQFSAVDQPESEQPPNSQMNMAAGRRKTSESGQRSEETTFSSLESGSLNGDAKRNGKSRHRRRRRRKRSSNSENGTEKVKNQTKADEKPEENVCQPSSTAPGLSGFQSERANVWFEHSPYEQAESLYQSQLVSSSNVTTQSNWSPPGMVQESQSFSAVTSSSSHLVCHNGDQVACHHVVQQVSAESCYVEEYMQTSILNSLDLSSTSNLNCVAPRIPDKGYPSLTATPATPVTQCVAVTPTNQQSINGLPHIPVELPSDVWLENPMYDHAEAAFYENLYNNTSRSNDHPQSLVEVEEDTEADEQEIAAVEEVRVIQQGKVEVFHALHPIQEEAEPVEAAEKEDESGASVCFFLHPDNGRVWLDNGRYDAAESQFYQNRCEKASGVKKERSTGAIAASVSTAATNTNMSTVDNLAQEQIWFEKPRYDEAERRLYEHVYSSSQPQEAQDAGANTILQDIARAQENIQKTLAGLKTTLRNRDQTPVSQQSKLSTASSTNANTADQEILSRIRNLELENQSLYKALSKLECRVALLEKTPAAAAAPSVPCTNGKSAPHKSRALVKEEDNDDDIDLFGSDEDDDEAEKLKEQRLKEYVEKKAKKPTLIAKSSILLDVKPWDDETDMVKLEECVRSIQTDGLLWGTSKLVPVGYGIKKLQITCVVEDDKVGTDLLEEEITKFEDFVQSVDVAAFNKI